MDNTEKNIFEDIASCKLCENSRPYHFELGRQKIMLISLVPSYAAMHRPLYFIQVFRKICLALFGDVSPSEEFIKEFYDPAGNIYWTHYRKCFPESVKGAGPKSCEHLLKKEIELLDPEIIVMLGKNIINQLGGDDMEALRINTKADGTPRQVFLTDFPTNENAKNFEEIRKALKKYISRVKIECEALDFAGANFMDLEYASIEFLNETGKSPAVKINDFEHEWVNGIILPNIKAYNLILQIFIFIESNIKNLLESKLLTLENIEKVWFRPFEELLTQKYHDNSALSRTKRKEARELMEGIDCLHALRNAISHKSGVIYGQNKEANLKNIAKIKRLKGVYIYGGNSIFVSKQGIDYIFGICENFKKIYTENFIAPSP